MNLLKRVDFWVFIVASLALILGAQFDVKYFNFTKLEIAGFITGAASVWLLVRENIWAWPVRKTRSQGGLSLWRSMQYVYVKRVHTYF